jgi:hypothetical protein
MPLNDLPVILIGFATIWLWGFSIGLEYGLRRAQHIGKDDDASYSN